MRARSTLTRRDIFRLAAVIPFATACSSQQAPKQPDRLVVLLRAAQNDSALARSIATAHTDLADSATAIAHDREQHADALQREIDRVNPPSPKQSSSTAPSPAPPPAPASSSDAKAALADSLRAAQGQAANLVTVVAPYRAGLVGSISASCASLLEVLA